MSSYEIFLLTGAFVGALATMGLASVILDRGSLRVFLTLALLCGGALYMAHISAPDGLNVYDIPNALAKLVAYFKN